MKFPRAVLTLLILACCAMLVLTVPPTRTRAEDDDIINGGSGCNGNVCDQGRCTYNNCVFRCGSNYTCGSQCDLNYGYCLETHNCVQ